MPSKKVKNKNLVEKPSLQCEIWPALKAKDILNVPSPSCSYVDSAPQREPGSSEIHQTVTKNITSTRMESLRTALELNRQMKKMIKEESEQIKVSLKKNTERQATLKKLMMEDKEAKNNLKAPSTVRAISVFAAPYFRDFKRMICPLNDDAQLKRRSHDINTYLNPSRPFHRNETKSLLNGVTAYALAAALKPLKFKRDHLKSKLKNDKDITDEDIEYLQTSIAETEDKIKEVSGKPLKELLENIKDNIDWMTISSVNLQGCRTPEDCEIMWNNYLGFHVNKGSYTPEEDSRIRQLADHYRGKNWDAVARHLKTNRTAIQCFVRYQEKLNPHLCKKYWTAEEDKLLLKYVNEFKVGSIIPWNKISMYMEGRTRQQIINRYERSVSQTYNRGPWTHEEDAILLGCVSKFGSRWAKMKPFFQRRSTYAIRERYVNTLDPTLKIGSWSAEEDAILIAMVKQHGFGKWAKICKEIPGRTDNMCLTRANRLLENSVKRYNKGSKIDLEINDPELFTSLIRPSAPTKFLERKFTNLKQNREDAYKLFITALEKVDPSFKIEDDPEGFDYNLLPLDTLHRVSDELHHMLNLKLAENPVEPNERIYGSSKRHEKDFPPVETDIEDEELEELYPVIEEFSDDKRHWMNTILDNIFITTSKVMSPFNLKTPLEYNHKENAESTLFKTFLYKATHCKSFSDPDDDIEDVTFNGVKFTDTMQTAVSYFVQPPVYDEQFIVLAPNITTLGAMEVMQATEPQVRSMAEFVRFSNPYVKYLCEKSDESPKCLQCFERQKVKLKEKLSVDIMLSDMKEKFFTISEKMEEVAQIEAATLRTYYSFCSCSALAKSRDALRLMRRRFLSMFLWPGLLSSTELTQEQEEIMCTRRSDKKKNYFLRMPVPLRCLTGPKGIHKNGIKTKSMKKRYDPTWGKRLRRKKLKSNNDSKTTCRTALSVATKRTSSVALQKSPMIIKVSKLYENPSIRNIKKVSEYSKLPDEDEKKVVVEVSVEYSKLQDEDEKKVVEEVSAEYSKLQDEDEKKVVEEVSVPEIEMPADVSNACNQNETEETNSNLCDFGRRNSLEVAGTSKISDQKRKNTVSTEIITPRRSKRLRVSNQSSNIFWD